MLFIFTSLILALIFLGMIGCFSKAFMTIIKLVTWGLSRFWSVEWGEVSLCPVCFATLCFHSHPILESISFLLDFSFNLIFFFRSVLFGIHVSVYFSFFLFFFDIDHHFSTLWFHRMQDVTLIFLYLFYVLICGQFWRKFLELMKRKYIP